MQGYCHCFLKLYEIHNVVNYKCIYIKSLGCLLTVLHQKLNTKCIYFIQKFHLQTTPFKRWFDKSCNSFSNVLVWYRYILPTCALGVCAGFRSLSLYIYIHIWLRQFTDTCLKSESKWWLEGNDYIIANISGLNSLCAKLFRGNINMYLHFMSFLHTDMP